MCNVDDASDLRSKDYHMKSEKSDLKAYFNRIIDYVSRSHFIDNNPEMKLCFYVAERKGVSFLP